MGTHPIFESDFDCLTDLTMADRFDDGSANRIHLTGPDGQRDHHITNLDARQIGIVALPELARQHKKLSCLIRLTKQIIKKRKMESSHIEYTTRQSRMNYALFMKNSRVGGIGWMSGDAALTTDLTGNYHGIQKGPFRAQVERFDLGEKIEKGL